MFKRIQQQAAFIEFAEKNFDEAGQHFKESAIDIREVKFKMVLFLFFFFMLNQFDSPNYISFDRFISSKKLIPNYLKNFLWK